MILKHVQIKWVLPIVFVFSLLINGCSPVQQSKVPPTDNRRKQVQMQRHLRKLNRENEKLRELVTEAAVVNEETGEVIGNNLVTKENLPEMQKLLNDFKQVNQETDKLLLSYQRSLEKDIEKNKTLEEMLNGFADECESQSDRRARMKGLLKIDEDEQINFQAGITAFRISGNVSENNETYAHNGYSGSLYFTYIADNNLAIGLRRINIHTIRGDASSDGLDASFPEDPTIKYASEINALSLGFILHEIKSMSVVPQLIYGIGKTSGSGVNSDFSYKGDVTLQGFELPFNWNYSTGLSFGFRIGAYQLTSTYKEAEINGNDFELTEELTTNSTMVGLGINIGGAW